MPTDPEKRREYQRDYVARNHQKMMERQEKRRKAKPNYYRAYQKANRAATKEYDKKLFPEYWKEAQRKFFFLYYDPEADG